MKNAFFALTVCLTSGFASAQELGKGTHVFTNDVTRLVLVVGDDAYSQEFAFSDASGLEDKGEGIFRESNDLYWYELHGETCNYEFDDPMGDASHLTVSIYDCKNGKPNRKVELTLSE